MRSLSAPALAAIASRIIRPAYFYEGVFGANTLRLWSGLGDFTLDGDTYLGNGWFHGFSNIRATLANQATGISVKLTGVPGELISLILNNSNESFSGRFFFALLDEDESVLHAETEFVGELDTIKIDENDSDSAITINYENQFVRLKNPREPRWTDAMHKVDYAGDLGFEYVAFLQQQRIYWGRPDTTRGR